ncbi:hypothetical protein WA158_008315 [Blastocystis sp. Blastoise]
MGTLMYHSLSNNVVIQAKVQEIADIPEKAPCGFYSTYSIINQNLLKKYTNQTKLLFEKLTAFMSKIEIPSKENSNNNTQNNNNNTQNNNIDKQNTQDDEVIEVDDKEVFQRLIDLFEKEGKQSNVLYFKGQQIYMTLTKKISDLMSEIENLSQTCVLDPQKNDPCVIPDIRLSLISLLNKCRDALTEVILFFQSNQWNDSKSLPSDLPLSLYQLLKDLQLYDSQYLEHSSDSHIYTGTLPKLTKDIEIQKEKELIEEEQLLGLKRPLTNSPSPSKRRQGGNSIDGSSSTDLDREGVIDEGSIYEHTEPREGEDYQAVIPRYNPRDYLKNTVVLKDECVWLPHQLSIEDESKFEGLLSIFRSTEMQQHFYDEIFLQKFNLTPAYNELICHPPTNIEDSLNAEQLNHFIDLSESVHKAYRDYFPQFTKTQIVDLFYKLPTGKKEDECSICSRINGTLLKCSQCPRVFHTACVRLYIGPHFICPYCFEHTETLTSTRMDSVLATMRNLPEYKSGPRTRNRK